MCLSSSQRASHFHACVVPTRSRSWVKSPLSSASVTQFHSSGCGPDTSLPFHTPLWEVTNEKGRGCGRSQSNPSLPSSGPTNEGQGSHPDIRGTTQHNSDGSDPLTVVGRCTEKENRDHPITLTTMIPLVRGVGAGDVPLEKKGKSQSSL